MIRSLNVVPKFFFAKLQCHNHFFLIICLYTFVKYNNKIELWNEIEVLNSKLVLLYLDDENFLYKVTT